MSAEPKSDVTTRAEIASLDRIRTSPWLQDHLKPRAGDSVPARGNIAQISFSKNSFVIAAQSSITFPNIGHLPNIGFAQNASYDAFDLGGIRSVRGPNQEPSVPKMRRDDGIADHRA